MPDLTDKFVASAQLGEHTDGLVRGLILLVRRSANGQARRSWVLRASHNGRRLRIGLGSYPLVGLAAARQKARDALRALDEGKDPSRSGRARQRASDEASILTFGGAVDLYLAKVAQPYKNARNDHARERALRELCGDLHPKTVEKVTPLDVALILRSLPRGIALKAQVSLRALFAFAMVEKAQAGVHFLNPASAELLKAVGYIARKNHVRHPALDFRQAAEFMRAVEAIDTPAARCIRFIGLTASRSGAARLARHDQIDRVARLWRCPPEQMKDGRHRSEPFIVPLSDAALEAVGEPGSSPFVFAASDTAPITDMVLGWEMRRLTRDHPEWNDNGKPPVLHGLRATFRSVGAVQSPGSRDCRACAWPQGLRPDGARLCARGSHDRTPSHA